MIILKIIPIFTIQIKKTIDDLKKIRTRLYRDTFPKSFTENLKNQTCV